MNVAVASTSVLVQRLRNLSASMLLIAAIAAAYASIPYFQAYFSQRAPLLGVEYSFWQVLLTTTLGYALLLLLFYLFEPAPRISKSIYCLRGLKRLAAMPLAGWRTGLPFDERLGLLSVLLKAFFAPMMVVSLFVHSSQMLSHGGELLASWGDPDLEWLALFNADGFWFMFKVILLLDVFFFTLGYLIELPGLRNEIRSVDSTLLGWGVALACYPPFNGITATIFGGYSTDFPLYENPVIHVMANFLLLGLMAIYTCASVALNFKASNLTHRGIIALGPYRYIRHPAYACKNLAWWIGVGPALISAVGTSFLSILTVLGSMIGWTFIYYMRAITEEDHLRSVDSEYDAYCQKVKYRFIPGVI